jgi:outer membrane protein assembly factor BamB
MRALRACAALVVLALGSAWGLRAAGAVETDKPGEAWPQWLGPDRTGAASAQGVFRNVGAPRLRVAWRQPIGSGAAGLAVVDDRIVTLESDGERDRAVAFEASSGRRLWSADLDASLEGGEQGPASTPALGNGLAFVVTPACQLRALDLATGKVAWHVDLKERFAAAPRRGCASSPLLDGGRVILHSGAADDHRTVALSAASGEVLWTAKGVAPSTYGSPGRALIAGQETLLVQHTDNTDPNAPRGGLTALRPRDGAVIWHTTLDKNWSWETPVPFGDGRVLLATWNDATAFRAPAAEGKSPEKLWTTEDLRAYPSPPVVHQDHLYGFAGDFLTCVKARDGSRVWAEKLYSGSLALADGHLVVLSSVAGTVWIVAATPEGYRERTRLDVLARGARSDTPPSVAGRRIFVRNDEEVAAVEVEG